MHAEHTHTRDHKVQGVITGHSTRRTQPHLHVHLPMMCRGRHSHNTNTGCDEAGVDHQQPTPIGDDIACSEHAIKNPGPAEGRTPDRPRRSRPSKCNCSRHQESGTQTRSPTRAGCSTDKARPPNTARHHEGTTPGTTTAQGQTGEPEPTQTPSQHTDYSDHTDEYSTSNVPHRHTPRPERTKYSTQSRV